MTPRMRRLIASAGMPVIAAVLTALLAAGEDAPSTPPITGGILAARPAAANRVLARAPTFAAIAQRPLFLPGRRPEPEPASPPPAPPAPAQPAAPPALSATLVGVLISPTGRSAILRLGDGKSATVPEGGTVQGWTLKQVSPDRVSFVSGSTSIDLAFPTHQAAPTTPGAAFEQSVAAVAARRRR
jgi:hypothetical protein